MGKNKTVYVWIILILSAIGIIFGAINIIFNLINIKVLLTPALFSNPTINIINLVLSGISLIILVIFFFKLFNVTPDIIKWTHIAFGFSVFNMLLNVIFSIVLAGLLGAILSSIGLVIFLPIIIIIWVTFALHLKKAQRENLMDFS